MRFAALCVAMIVSTGAIAAPLSPTQIAAIDAAALKALATTGVPAVSIAVVRDGQIAYTHAYGVQKAGVAARADARYKIASISKQFTAAALLLLAEDGKLSLDDPVSKYLPDLTRAKEVKLRQLLSHTSGYRDFWPQDFSFADMERPTTPGHILDKWARVPLDFDPGTRWQYSNTGYVVAGMIAEKAAGEPLMAYLKRKIFDPLGMKSVRDLDETNGPAFPHGYGRYALGPVRQVTPPADGWLWAAGELSMTAEDLAKWDIARLDRTLIPAEDWTTQETTIKLNDGKDSGYGLGVFVRDGERKAITHGGEAVGFLSTNNVFPAERAAIVVLTNSWSGDAHSRIARDIAKIVLPPVQSDATSQAQAARARSVFEALRAGKLDRSQLTENANYYFTQQAIADYQFSLAPLGNPIAFEPAGKPILRGGFVIQGYTIKYPSRTLELSTFYEPGSNGRIEQFLVTPGE